MTRRTKWVAGGLAGLFAAAGVAVAAWPRAPHPCRATFERVREGMTRAEVVATVGGPPGDYSRGQAIPTYFADKNRNRLVWLAMDGELIVVFDADETALWVMTGTPDHYRQPSRLVRARKWLGVDF